MATPLAQLPFASTSPITKVFTPTNYTVVDGFFVQSSPNFNDTKEYDLLEHSFGLVDSSHERWSRFQAAIDQLNERSDKHTAYKVFFLARHGQGWHNVAEAKYGTDAWNNKWSMEYGDGNLTWGPDPELTPLGTRQAQAVNRAWKKQIQAAVPLPSKLYSSPLDRAASTLESTWKDILIDSGEVRPLFVEHLREVIGVHTCDQRSRKSTLKKRFPAFDFDQPFSEHDQLWSPDFQESPKEQALRIQQFLNRIFATDPVQYISITAHGGVIASFLRVVNHRHVSVPPGGMIPVVVKAVDYLDADNELLAGGQSIPRPRKSYAES
ncbi:putative phosphomutase [Sporobolomyces koalae]|uniref:putative phosphomutase n=1 Tax=Sporobolomyces koalae TaxID=500713 RepID=UPI003171BF7D